MKIQLRGNCQCCGRDQAVVRGAIAKHGYEVKDGWFQGVCQGHQYKPMQVERLVADQIIASCRRQAVELDQRAADYRVGRIRPDQVKVGDKQEVDRFGRLGWVDVMVPYYEADVHSRRAAIKAAIYQAESRASSARSFADGLERCANEHHGHPLREVKAQEAAARIESGERRQVAGGAVLIADYQDGAMVRYHYFRASVSGAFRGRMASRSWRALPLVQAEVAA